MLYNVHHLGEVGKRVEICLLLVVVLVEDLHAGQIGVLDEDLVAVSLGGEHGGPRMGGGGLTDLVGGA